MHFLREKPKEKSVLLRSLINKQGNITSDNRPKNPHPTFPSKENNSETKVIIPPIKDDVIDFCIGDTTIKSDTGKNKVISGIKKDQFKQNALVESNTKREEHGIATEGRSEIVSALAYTDTNDAKSSPSL